MIPVPVRFRSAALIKNKRNVVNSTFLLFFVLEEYAGFVLNQLSLKIMFCSLPGFCESCIIITKKQIEVIKMEKIKKMKIKTVAVLGAGAVGSYVLWGL